MLSSGKVLNNSRLNLGTFFKFDQVAKFNLEFEKLKLVFASIELKKIIKVQFCYLRRCLGIETVSCRL